jgi:two-component system LytT family response regulator
MIDGHTVVIVDDEPLARRRLRQLIGAAPGFNVISEVADGTSALQAMQGQPPDVLFLDIEIPGLDVFSLCEALGDRAPAIVFVTAYPEHAPRAFEIEAVDYLVKPVTRDRFSRTLGRLRRVLGGDRRLRGTQEERPTVESESTRPIARVLIPGGRQDIVVPVAEIDWLSADGAYLIVHTCGRRHVIRDSLVSLLRRLDERQFMQVHRSAAVNLDRVRATRRTADGQLAVVLADGTRVDVSRRRADAVLAKLGRLSR